VVSIAGELKERGGGDMDVKLERLKTSASHSDSEKEGVRVEMNGGFRTLESGTKRNQKAIVEFVCDRNREGLENLYDPKDEYAEEKVKRAEGDKEDEDDPKSSSLKFVRYDQDEGDADILRMQWRTKYACEDSKGEQDAEKGNHWGFFTWFILMFVPQICPPNFFPDTDPTKQCFPVNSDISNLWLMAQLQPIRCPRMGPTTSR
jgi:autophagy-related protein 27